MVCEKYFNNSIQYSIIIIIIELLALINGYNLRFLEILPPVSGLGIDFVLLIVDELVGDESIQLSLFY